MKRGRDISDRRRSGPSALLRTLMGRLTVADRAPGSWTAEGKGSRTDAARLDGARVP